MFIYIWLYRLISVGLTPFLLILLWWRIFKQKENRQRVKERFGQADLDKWRNLLLWEGHQTPLHQQIRVLIHASSVGEANSAWFLACELLNSNHEIRIIFTTTTLTSSKLIENKIDALFASDETKINRIIHQFLPFDSFFWVEKFLGIWRPKICLLIESEIWPNLIFSASDKKIPLFLINARISEKSSRNWFLAKKLGFRIFDYFATIFAQSESDATRICSLTQDKVLFNGNLKSQALCLEFDKKKLSELKEQIGSRKLWLCASTHKGEEEIIIQTHQKLKSEFPDLLTIIALRHPHRSDEVSKLFWQRNFAIHSKHEAPSNETEFYLVDTLGELATFYQLADFAFIGGSIAEIGGHNPFEAIIQGCAVISGKKVSNFSEIYSDLEASSAAILVNDGDELFETVGKFLRSKTLIEEHRNSGLKFLNSIPKPSTTIITKINELLK